MAILITGAAGYIGSFAVRRLMSLGHEVVALDNLSMGFRESLPKDCTFIHADVLDILTLEKLFHDYKIESILHFAAKTVVSESVEDPEGYFHNNFGGSAGLLKTAIAAGVKRFIFSSTATVYAPNDALFIEEPTPLGPISPYGESKWLTEQLLQKLHESEQLSFIALRYFNVAGACLDGQLGQKTKNSTHLVKVAAELAVGKRKYIEVYGDDYQTGDGTTIRDYIHVEDLVEAHVLALQYLKENHSAEFINCGYGQGASVFEVLKAMEKVSGRKFERRVVKRRPGDTDRLVADSSKIRKMLGWTPRFDDLETICRTAYLWEKSLL